VEKDIKEDWIKELDECLKDFSDYVDKELRAAMRQEELRDLEDELRCLENDIEHFEQSRVQNLFTDLNDTYTMLLKQLRKETHEIRKTLASEEVKRLGKES